MTKNIIMNSGTFEIGNDLSIYRLGFGAMRVTGVGIWGEPKDHDEAIRLLKHVIDLGINFIDTADSYGPAVSENLIAEALYPYPTNLVIATKGGLIRPGPGQWIPNGKPNHLREACEASLKRLKLDSIPLYQLHTIDPNVPVEDQIGVLIELKKEGKIRHLGLSNVSVKQIERVRSMTDIASVQNRYNLADRQSEDVLHYCERENIGFIPWFPLASGNLVIDQMLARLSSKLNAAPSQIALAWLLQKSPVMLPIPGTSSIKHLEENTNAALLTLDDTVMGELDKISLS